MDDGRRRREQGNEFVQMNLPAIQPSKELQRKRVSGWRNWYLKKAWIGKMDHVRKVQSFSH